MTAATITRPVQVSPDDSAPTRPLSAVVFPGKLAISVAEFAEATGTGETNIRLAVMRGEIPSRRVGRRILIPLAALDKWLATDGPDAA